MKVISRIMLQASFKKLCNFANADESPKILSADQGTIKNMQNESFNSVNPKVSNAADHNIYQALAFAVTLLFLLVIMKVKLLSGYPFLWAKILKLTQKYFPESLGFFNPVFYIDDLYVAFLIFVLFYYLFKKNKLQLNALAYFTYLVICIFSIFSSFIFYKYETPINLSTLRQIDSLYTMRTSIDTELMENYRFIAYLALLIVFSILFPLLLNFLKKKIFQNYKQFHFFEIRTQWIVLFIFLFSSVFIIKSYSFSMEILTESPVTTLFKSIVVNLNNSLIDNPKEIPLFDDKVSNCINDSKYNVSNLNRSFRKKYNVILIVLETTNYRYFLPKGKFLKYFPNLYELNKRGLYYPNFFSPFPRSSKAFFAILTGHYPLTSYKSIIKIAPQIKVPSIFQVLKSNGYSTFAGYSGDFKYDRMDEFLKNRGVDRFVDIYNNDGKYNQISWCADDEMIYDHLMDWIVSLDGNVPFLGFLLPMNSHHPFWTPKNEFKIMPENDKESRYINALHYQDFLVGKLFNFLQRTNKLEDTIVIITGDHGTVFNSLDQNNMKKSSYLIDRDCVQVPFYIYLPFKKSIKPETEIIGNHVDIMPTILDTLGIEIGDKIQGRSLFDPKIRERISFIYNDYYRHTVTGLTNNYYLIRDMTEDLTILSKSLNFQQNYCVDNKELCELISTKVDNFDKYQNHRLYRYF